MARRLHVGSRPPSQLQLLDKGRAVNAPPFPHAIADAQAKLSAVELLAVREALRWEDVAGVERMNRAARRRVTRNTARLLREAMS